MTSESVPTTSDAHLTNKSCPLISTISSDKYLFNKNLVQINLSKPFIHLNTPRNKKRRLVAINKHDIGPLDLYQMDNRHLLKNKNNKILSNNQCHFDIEMSCYNNNTSEELSDDNDIDNILLNEKNKRKNFKSLEVTNFLSSHNRRCTNVFFLILLIIFIGGWIFISYEGLVYL